MMKTLPTKNPGLLGFAVLGAMRWPNDPEAVQSFILAMVHGARSAAEGEKPNAVTLMLLDEIEKSNPRGSYAGKILLHLIEASTSQPDDCSVNKAMFLTWKSLDGVLLRNNKAAPSEKSTIKRAWREYKDVSHFFAAIEILMQMSDNDPSKLAFQDILAISEKLVELAENIPALIEWKPWRIMPGTQLPSCNLAPAPLTQDAIAALRDYSARDWMSI